MNILLVEGKLDIEVLQPVFAGNPVVERAGAKGNLAPQAKNRVAAYLRDRDFDYRPGQPPFNAPAIDKWTGAPNQGPVLGWRWQRHEIENYLLDPAIVTAAWGWPEAEYAAALLDAARILRPYQIARWVLGTARQELPPRHEFPTRPAGLPELGVPADLSEPWAYQWATGQCAGFLERLSRCLGEEAVRASLEEFSALLSEDRISNPEQVLLHCSGKDLLAALAPWLQTKGIRHDVPGAGFRDGLRNWVRENPEEALQRLPEWQGLVAAVRQA